MAAIDTAFSKDCGECPIRHRAVCSRCEPEELLRLEAIKYYRSFEPGQTVIWSGDRMDFVASVVSGVATLSQTMEDGRTQMVGLLLPSDFVGRPGRETASFDVRAVTPVLMCCFRRKPFEEMMERTPRIGARLLEMMLDELDAAREWITLLGGQTVAQKLAGFLLLLCRRWPYMGCALAPDREHVEINVPIGRSDLAQYLGTTVETISRTVQGLDRQGILKVITPSRLMVRDMEGLIALSGNTDFDAESVLKRVAGAA